jgi:hypothetical protein
MMECRTYILMGLSLCSLVGCAEVPKPKTFTAVAVTRPQLCNDYPVTYRVQVPEADDRIKMIDRTELVSSTTYVHAYPAPHCAR